MKKAISVLVSVLILFMFVCPFSSPAAGGMTVEVSSSKATAGEKGKATISFKNCPGITSAKFKVSFDSGLTLENVTYGDKLSGMKAQVNSKKSPVVLNWVNGIEDIKGDFVYATLTFAPGSKTESGDYKISLSYDPEDISDTKENNVAFTITGAQITVDGNSSSSVSNQNGDTPATDPGDDSEKDGYMNENGEYVGGEEEIEIVEEGDALTTTGETQTGKKRIIIPICVAAAVLIAAAVVVVIVFKKRKVREID